MLNAGFGRLLHFMLSRVKATNLDGDETLSDAKIEADLDACLKQMNNKLNTTVEVEIDQKQKTKKTNAKIKVEKASTIKGTKKPPKIEAIPKPKPEMESVLNDLEEYCHQPTEAARYSNFVGAVNGALALLQPLTIGAAGPSPENAAPNYLVSLVNAPKVKTSTHKGNEWDQQTDIDFTFMSCVRQLPGVKYRRSSYEKLMSTLRTSGRRASDSCAIPWKDTLACCKMMVEKEKLGPAIHAIRKYKNGAPLERLNIAVLPEKDTNHEFEGEGEREGREELSKSYESTSSGPSKKRRADVTLAGPTRKRSKDLDRKSNSLSEYPTGAEKPLSLPAQIEEYATDVMYNCFGRDHVIHFAITDEILQVWYYDHQGPIQVSGINFIRDLPHFLLLLYALQRFSLEDWGFIPELRLLETRQYVSLESKNPDLSNASDPAEVLKPSEALNRPNLRRAPPRVASQRNKPGVIISEPTSQPQAQPPKQIKGYHFRTSEQRRLEDYKIRAASGRSTWVVHGETYNDDAKAVEAVVKLSYREESRHREGYFIQQAKDLCIKNKFEDFCDHLPDILFEQEFPRFSTAIIRDHLNARKENNDEYDRLDIRVPYMIVMPKYEPITTTTKNWNEFIDAFVTLFFVHALLWSLGVEHGDISDKNLMWDPKTQQPKLCDYDLSQLTYDVRPTGFSNTGTWRFMSLELLSADAMDGNIRRAYRHDVESFITVMLWILCRVRDGKEIPRKMANTDQTQPRLLDDWNQERWAEVRQYRERTWNNLFTMPIPHEIPKETWELFTSFAAAYRQGISDGVYLRERELSGAKRTQEMFEMDVRYNSVHFIEYFLMKNHRIPRVTIIAERLWKFAALPRIQNFITDYYKFETRPPVKPFGNPVATV